MRSGWVETTLGEVTAVNPGRLNGVSPDEVIRYVDISSVSWDGGIDVRSVAAMPFGEAPGRARRPINEKDVVVSTVRPRLRAMGQVPPSLAGQVASTGLCVLRSHDPQVILPDYVWQVVRHQPFTDWLVERETGSNYPAVRSSDIEAYRFPLPPIEEQRRIVDLMSHVDTTLAADRSESVALAKCASSLRADTFSHPEGPRLVGDVYQITTGKQLQSSNTTGECFEYVRAGNIGEGGVLDLAVMKSMYFSSQEIDRLALCAGDVLIVEGGNGFGKSAIWPGSDQVTGYQNHVLRVRSTSEQYPPELAYQWSRWCHENGLFKPTGTGIPSLGLRRVKAMPVPGNSPQLMEAVRTLTTIEQALDARRQAAERCERLRSAFLAALVSGGHSIPVSYDEFIRDEGAA